MSYVIAAPEMVAAAAGDLATVDSSLHAAQTAAAGPTVAIVPAAADEVSASIAHLFSQHAEHYQALAGQSETRVVEDTKDSSRAA
jgi:PE family